MGTIGAMMQPQAPVAPSAGLNTLQGAYGYKPTQPQGGMLGALGGMFNDQNRGRNLRIIGAALRQISHPEANSLDDLLAQLDQERQQQTQAAWQQTLQQHQLGEWKQQDQQTQDEGALADQAPESIRPFAHVAPHEYATGILGASLHPQMRTLSPQEVRAAGFQPGTVVQVNPATGEYNVQQNPYHPPAAMMGNGTDGGAFTPNPAGVAPPAVGSIEEGYRYNGGDPADPNSWSRVR
jgi:hypothetical protein